jgi:GntR family transcriptional repressor for pyruvate dehydrogenase complex
MTRAERSDEARPARPVRLPRRQKVATTIAQAIVSEISKNHYAPGTKLPAEREMLEQYQAGRGTLRESLRFLEMNGVITVRPGPGGGPVVAEPNARDLASTLGLFLELNGTSFGAILEVREVLEPAIARLAAAATGNKEIVERIGRSVDAMADNLDDIDRFLEENEEFHHLVAAAAGNPIFALLIGSLDHITDGTRVGIDFPLRRRKAVLAAHRRIFDAIAAHDSEAAREAMHDHVVAFTRYTQKHYPHAAEGTLRWADVAP